MDLFQMVRNHENEGLLEMMDSIDLKQINKNGKNLLHEAVSFRNNTIFEKLIEKGIDVNHQDSKGQTPRHYCAGHQNLEMAKAILESRGDLNITDKHGENSLWTAVFNAKGEYGIVSLFLKYIADKAIKNTARRSSLEFALQINDQKLIKMLNK